MKISIGSAAFVTLLLHAIVSQSVFAQSSWSQDSWPRTDFSKTSILLNEVRGGGPPKDGIPAIDSPQFDRVSDAPEWLNPMEPVIVVASGDIAKAYPLQIMTYHEIVNDEINGVPVSVTFCPLCNASIVFDRRYEGEVLDFGTTGLLRKSDLVMYDRQSESWWQQFSGKAIVGRYLDAELHRVPSSIVSYQSFEQGYPEGLLLNRNTGFNRPYGRNPYSGYDDINESPFLFSGKVDERLPPMERVLSVRIDELNKIYPLSALQTEKLVNDQVGSVPVVVFATGELLSVLDKNTIADSRLVPEVTVWNSRAGPKNEPLTFHLQEDSIYDDQTGSRWDIFGRAIEGDMKGLQLTPVESGVHFAFAWLAFNPESEIFESN